MGEFYSKVIEKYGAKLFKIFFALVFALGLTIAILLVTTILQGQMIILERLPIVFLGLLGFGYIFGYEIVKKVCPDTKD